LIHENKISKRKNGQNYFKRQNERIVLYSHEISMLKDVSENQGLKKYGAT
jgi:hypothetical protein